MASSRNATQRAPRAESLVWRSAPEGSGQRCPRAAGAPDQDAQAESIVFAVPGLTGGGQLVRITQQSVQILRQNPG